MTQQQWETRLAEKIFVKSNLKKPKSKRSKAARLIANSWTWEVEAKWKGDIEYEKAEIVSPLKVAMMVARSLRAGCVSVSIVRKSNTVAESANSD